MLSTKLSETLALFNKSRGRAESVILIDGKWGCGKTYAVNSFFNSVSSPSVFLSLFGLKNSDDVIIRLSEYIDSSFIANINGHFELVPSPVEKKFNGNIIVFDDLERMSDGLKFSSFYGIVNSLKMLGFKIVCIVNSDGIKEDIVGFDRFKEKVVDNIVPVSADSSLFSKITKNAIKLSDEYAKTILKDADENWRTIIRATKRYKKIIKRMDNFNEREHVLTNMNITLEDFYRCCCLADMCYFSSDRSNPNIQNDMIRIHYEEFVNSYKQCAANSLYNIFYVKKENRMLMQIVEELLTLYETYDYDSFVGNYIKTNDLLFDANPILNERPLFLSDYKRKKYKSVFIANVEKFDFSISFHKQKLNEFLHIYLDSLNKNDIDLICNRIIKTVSTNKSEELIGELLFDYNGNAEKLESFKQKLTSLFNEKIKNESSKTLDDLFGRKDFLEMLNFIYQKRYEYGFSKDVILKRLADNNFFLPDLHKEINYSAWSFCNEMARFVRDTDYESYFIRVLSEQCEMFPNSVSLRDRCNRLVKYNFNLDGHYFNKKD